MGLIPAHAGKTHRIRDTRPKFRAHPRSRGENPKFPPTPDRATGSSPLTRGKRRAYQLASGRGGLIPAHAGKTKRRQNSRLRCRAHPRSRGENPHARGRVRDPGGSSPLTRGKHVASVHHADERGLIPAHAGKTPGRRCRYSPGRAHPRSRGENSFPLHRLVDRFGSSPLTRGKLQRRQGDRHTIRLIPAHAGKTRGLRSRQETSWAHPRSRGENENVRGSLTSGAGSSPLTRGKPQTVRPRGHERGLIPAHAGKTSASKSCTDGTRAHPRSRGENRSTVTS